MEDNRKFATFFADAPKGKKIGAVLSWIATVILLVALFVPGYQLRYQMKTEKGTFKEMSCVEGGGIISQVCYAFGRMFRSTYYDKWESESKTLEQSHGAVVSKKNGVYTYSDGYTHTMSGGSNWGFTSLGDFFYGIGDLFAAFYL